MKKGSRSEVEIQDAIERAVGRGIEVKVRFQIEERVFRNR
jgi:hypothetical protein